MLNTITNSGITKPHKGQIQVDLGVLIMGYKGDPVFDNPRIRQRPAWTKDGSLMVFRKLEQDVPGFNKYLKDNGPRWEQFIPRGNPGGPLSAEEGANLFGAQLVGRWKSVCISSRFCRSSLLSSLRKGRSARQSAISRR